MPALYRASLAEPWHDVEIVSRGPDGFVLRETGKVWPGVILAQIDQVRIPVGVLEFREPLASERRAA